MITFISGGARSGKSSFAENQALSLYNMSEQKQLFYVATAEHSDSEMAERIQRHRESRESNWQTLETPIAISSIIEQIKAHDIVLLDCLTVWVNNMIFRKQAKLDEIIHEISYLIQHFKKKNASLFIVSNDVNEGFPIESTTVNEYIYQLEKAHHYITEHCDITYQVIGGIPIKWKG